MTITLEKTATFPTGKIIPIKVHRPIKMEKLEKNTKKQNVWQEVSPSKLPLELSDPSEYAEYDGLYTF